MLLTKKHLKKVLNNKIIENQITNYTILYLIKNSSQTLTNTIKIKTLTKILVKKNFNNIKNLLYIYPISYISLNSLNELLQKYSQLKQHTDFKKILIYNLKIKFLNFKNFNTLQFFNINNPYNIFFKLKILLNNILISFIFTKKLKKKK